jgi:hypothetical protein
MIFNSFCGKLSRPVHIAPLIYFRIVFGLVMFVSLIRFMLKGKVFEFYIAPDFFFTFYGFDWVKPFNPAGMYLVFIAMVISSIGIILGAFYRLSAIIFFTLFTYVELLDVTNYLNHYYFISVVGFLLILSPADKYLSVDAWRNPSLKITRIPLWKIGVFRLQIGLVYFFAGISKLNPDWLFNAMPLRIWLPAHTHLPVIGGLMDEIWVAYLLSWVGAIYDLMVPFLLIFRKTRLLAFIVLLLFHILTSVLFPVGMFPYIMMGLALIFFDHKIHKNNLDFIHRLLTRTGSTENRISQTEFIQENIFSENIVRGILIVFFIIQIFIPFRFLLYPGNLLWTEQGFRFSWRVMLMEKAGSIFFYVKDSETGRQTEILNSHYLTQNQEKMMSTQPDLILQFAHFLEEEFKKKGFRDPIVTAEGYVTLNGRGSQLFLDRTVDLTLQEDGFHHKKWILPFRDN